MDKADQIIIARVSDNACHITVKIFSELELLQEVGKKAYIEQLMTTLYVGNLLTSGKDMDSDTEDVAKLIINACIDRLSILGNLKIKP